MELSKPGYLSYVQQNNYLLSGLYNNFLNFLHTLIVIPMFGKKDFIKKTMDSITVGINVVIVQEENQFIAYCPALELSSYGDDIKQAKKRFEKEIEIFFEETSHRGTLEKYLLKLGWTLTQKPKPKYYPPLNIKTPYPNPLSSFTERVAIPF